MVHRTFSNCTDYFQPGDVLILNDSRVIPARLRGHNVETDGNFEVLLIEENGLNDWWAMLRPGKRAALKTRIAFPDPRGDQPNIQATVVEMNPQGYRRIRFEGTTNILNELERLGQVPLPPYIRREPFDDFRSDRERYQTVYARTSGSIAAPTAGLHFTSGLLEKLEKMGVEIRYVTLHVGPGTFAPVKSEILEGHVMHEERYSISEETAGAIDKAKAEGRRVIAIGTTSVRVLETAALSSKGTIASGTGRTRIFIHPPFRFKIIDGLITNFHLPCSTLLMLVSAFVTPGETIGRERILSVYEEAIRQRYRFFSYGDAVLIL